MPAILDRKPFYWALAIVALMVAVWLALEFVGDQRLHNTAWWQARHPVRLVSAPQAATPVDVRTGRLAQVAVQTEKGVYFLTGAKHVPAAGEAVVIQANERWELYLCSAAGAWCMTIHSFCAGAVWPHLQRDEQGRIDGCHAPHLANGTNVAVAAVTSPPPDRAGREGGRTPKRPPAQGMSHPREWAGAMGLPIKAAD